jgi:HlyD family secretion protein
LFTFLNFKIFSKQSGVSRNIVNRYGLVVPVVLALSFGNGAAFAQSADNKTAKAQDLDKVNAENKAQINNIGGKPAPRSKVGGQTRAAKVGIVIIKTEIVADFTDVQGRVVAGPIEAVTASSNAQTEILKFRLGDIVVPGDVIAVQNSEKFELKLSQLRARIKEARLKLADSRAEIVAEERLLELLGQQQDLLKGKAKRALELVANNALPADAAETATNASLSAKLAYLSRRASLDRKKSQILVSKVNIEQLQVEIAQVTNEIFNSKLKAKSAGQITYLADYSRGYAREGEVIAKIIDLERFEVEAEIPIRYLQFVAKASSLKGRGLDGSLIKIEPRVLLPQQDLRTATRTVRLNVVGKMPNAMQANNAVVVMQIPISSPAPQITVPKDAVLPVAGGHLVYTIEGNRAKRKIIQLGSSVANSFIIKSGLAVGEKVVIRGNEQLSDGKPVQIQGNFGKVVNKSGGKTDKTAKTVAN